MKSSEFITEAVNKRSYSKTVVDALTPMGFKVSNREQTPGAIKTWLKAPKAITLKEIVAALTTNFPGTKLEQWGMETMPDEIEGPGFRIEKQGKSSIFLAVFAGPKAEEYAMGLDEDNDEVDFIDDEMRNSDKRRARLQAEIAAGMTPLVHNVSSTSSPVYTMGDLQSLGWMDKEYTHDSSGEVDGWNRYYSFDAPGPIRVPTHSGKTAVWEPGHQEEN